nr:hypothetical protein [Micromonospora sp. DSM 115978]
MLAVLTATQHLLTSLDPLPYRERMNRLVGWARTAPDRAEICADLRGRDAYERQLALVAAMVVRDPAGIEAATRDPQPSIRVVALEAALRADLLTGDLLDVSAMERRRIYRTLRRLNSPAIADAMIGQIRTRYGDSEAAAVLPACGPETVRALLPELAYAVNLGALIPRHAGILLDHVERRLAEAEPEIRAQIWFRVAPAVLRGDPGRALDLIERYAPATRPPDLTAYGRLAVHDPGRVLRLLTAPGRGGWSRRATLPRSLRRRLSRLPTEQLVPLARLLRDRPSGFGALLGAVAPSRRGELYDSVMADVDSAAFEPDTTVMEALPVAVRVREATRVLAMEKTREYEAVALRWSSYLAWPDAVEALDVALRAGDAERRAQAYALLVDAARRSRDPRTVAELVARLGRLRNEQDPVRAAALTALARVARLLTPDAAPGLTRLVTDAVEARDASAATTAALSTLAADVLQHHVDVPGLCEWALLTIDLVATGARAPLLRRFDLVLRRGQERMVVERLCGWVEASAARGRYGPLFALTRALGRRAWLVPELQDLLRQAIGPHTIAAVASTAINLWLDDPRRRGERVAEIIAIDPSAVTIASVWRVICTYRTDLLDRVLVDQPPSGRFLQRSVRWAGGHPWCPQRWLPRQQAGYVALQERVAADVGATAGVRVGAIRAAARVPGPGRALVLRYLDAPEVVLAEAALGALVWTDRPDEALPVLLGYAGGDRARVAMYAAGRAARHIQPSQLADPLIAVLSAPVKTTSRKEAARLLGRYGPPAAMASLLAVHQAADTHRDVRAAIVSAARQRLDAEPSWAILAAAGAGSREERLAVLAAGPNHIAEHLRPRYASLIVAACRVPDREVRHMAYDHLPAWSRWAPGITGVIVDRLTDLGEPSVRYRAAELLRALDDTGVDAVFTRLVAADAADDRPGDAISDRPARRRVEELAEATSDWSRRTLAGADRSALITAARWLADQPGFTGAAMSMLVSLGRLDNLDEIADRCAGRPVLAARTAEQVGDRQNQLLGSIDPASLLGTVERLAARGDLTGGLFAVTLIGTGADFGWSTPWRDVLHSLRDHPDADVREEAYAVRMT